MDSDFPQAPEPTLSEDAVREVLRELMGDGWRIERERHHAHCYSIVIDEVRRITIQQEDRMPGYWRFRQGPTGRFYAHYATTPSMFRELLCVIAKEFSVDLGRPPDRVRFSQETPVSNVSMLVSLCAEDHVRGIHDPYFDDRAVANVATMHKLGARFASGLQILTGPHGAKRLNPDFLLSLWAELEVEGEVRVTSSAAHRRFLLLRPPMSVVLGPSLNQIAKDEAASREHAPDDHELFQEWWNASRRLSA